jgi:hypothetical protein
MDVSLMNLLSAILGAIIGGLATFIIVKWQMSKEILAKKNSYLTNLLEEFKYNLGVLRETQTYITEGPQIQNLFLPAEIITDSIRLNAWDMLVRAGVLSVLSGQCQIELRIADRSVWDARRVIMTMAANWHRIREWEEHDIEAKYPHPTSSKEYLKIAVREMQGTAELSIGYLIQGIKTLETLLGQIK